MFKNYFFFRFQILFSTKMVQSYIKKVHTEIITSIYTYIVQLKTIAMCVEGFPFYRGHQGAKEVIFRSVIFVLKKYKVGLSHQGVKILMFQKQLMFYLLINICWRFYYFWIRKWLFTSKLSRHQAKFT